MGYTVHWSSKDECIVNAQQFKVLASVLSKNANSYAMIVQVTETQIIVNGNCEPFVFVLDAIVPFGFCKTRRGVYTTPLVTSLIWLMLSHKNMSVTHDGEIEDLIEWLDDNLFKQLSGGSPDREKILQVLKDRDIDNKDENLELVLKSFIDNVVT